MSSELPTMGKVFDDYIRDKVRAAIINIAAPVIDEAVDEALKEFKIQVEQYRDLQYNRMVVNLMAERNKK